MNYRATRWPRGRWAFAGAAIVDIGDAMWDEASSRSRTVFVNLCRARGIAYRIVEGACAGWRCPDA